MPVDRIHSSPDSMWGLWEIFGEDEATLAAQVPFDKISDTLANPLKRLEFLAGRALIKRLLEHWNIEYQGLTKDVYGKPRLTRSEIHVSLSHSYPYVAAIVHKKKNVGIDLEQPKEKLLRIAPRILSETELKDAGQDIVKHCVYWCAKETLLKIYGKKDIFFSKNLLVDAFLLGAQGHLIGRIISNNVESAIPLDYLVSDNFVVVVST